MWLDYQTENQAEEFDRIGNWWLLKWVFRKISRMTLRGSDPQNRDQLFMKWILIWGDDLGAVWKEEIDVRDVK